MRLGGGFGGGVPVLYGDRVWWSVVALGHRLCSVGVLHEKCLVCCLPATRVLCEKLSQWVCVARMFVVCYVESCFVAPV